MGQFKWYTVCNDTSLQKRKKTILIVMSNTMLKFAVFFFPIHDSYFNVKFDGTAENEITRLLVDLFMIIRIDTDDRFCPYLLLARPAWTGQRRRGPSRLRPTTSTNPFLLRYTFTDVMKPSSKTFTRSVRLSIALCSNAQTEKKNIRSQLEIQGHEHLRTTESGIISWFSELLLRLNARDW